MSSLQRVALEIRKTRNCENCGVPFKAERARYCSRECRTAVDKGGKTYDEKKLAAILKCNEQWVNKKPRRRVQLDPKYYNMTTY